MKKAVSLLLIAVFIAMCLPFAVNAAFSMNFDTYKINYQSFLNDGVHSNGKTWTGSTGCRNANWSASGCCAYVHDFAKCVYGVDGNFENYDARITTNDASIIKTGDILYGWNAASEHWLVVLERDGNTLYTAEGNWVDAVQVSSTRYSISGTSLYYISNGASKAFTLNKIYRFADINTVSGIQQKLNQLKAVYPDSCLYFTNSGNICTNSGGSDCSLSNIPSRGGLPTGSSVSSTIGNGYSCNGFARYAFYYIFGRSFKSSPTVSTPSIGDVLEWNYQNSSGESVQHWAIYLGEEGNYYYVYDCNWDLKCGVQYWHSVSKSFGGGVTKIYHASNYDSVNNDTHTHSYTSEITTQPTCTTTGVRTFTCFCGASYTESIPAAHTPGSEATAESSQVCEVCGAVLREPLSASLVRTATLNGHTYCLYSSNASWQNAKALCEQYGGHLITITSEAEQRVFEAINSERVSLWIGLTDEDNEGSWEWVTGEPFAYSAWAAGEPNDANGGEDYAGGNPDLWNDYVVLSTTPQGFVLEFDHVVVTDEAVAPTCTQTGLTEGKHCSECQEVLVPQEVVPALGHDYQPSGCVETANCSHGLIVKYVCSRCESEYTQDVGTVTDWMTMPIDGLTPTETKTQYRYSDKDTQVSYEASMPGYEIESSRWVKSGTGSVSYVSSFPAGFDTTSDIYRQYNVSAPAAGETATEKRVLGSVEVTGYIYWHWICDEQIRLGNCYANRQYGTYRGERLSSYNQDATHFEYTITSVPMTFQGAGYGFKDTTVNLATNSKDYDYHLFWWVGNGNDSTDANLEIKKMPYTDYRKQFTYVQWSEWSGWQDAPIAEDDDRLVETRTLYRYEAETSHVPVTDAAVEPTCENTGLTAGSHCSVCGTVITAGETIPALGHDFVNGECTRCHEKEYPVTEDGIFSLTSSGSLAKAGDKTVITLSAKGTITSFAVIPQANSLVSLTKGSITAEGAEVASFSIKEGNGVCAFAEPTVVDGEVAQLTFTALNDVGADVTLVFTVNYEDENYQKHTETVSVTVPSVLRGDFDGNGTLTSADAVYLLRSILVGEENYPLNQSADVNGDGVLTSADSVYLLRHILVGEAAYPLF